MADDKKKDEAETEAEEAPKKSKKGLFIGGGITSLIAAAYMLFLVAVPKAPKDVPFEGPFVIALCQATPNVQANLRGDGGKRFVSMIVKAEFHAYSESYATDRTGEMLYQAKERDAILQLSRGKTKEDLFEQVGVDVYKRELRDTLDPLLFPIHVGNEGDPGMPHSDSGLAPGDSINASSMRGGFFDHSFTLDAPKGTIQLDSGQPVRFTGSETDLQVENEFGQYVFVNMTGVKPDFIGEIMVGSFGYIDEILFDQFIIQ